MVLRVSVSSYFTTVNSVECDGSAKSTYIIPIFMLLEAYLHNVIRTLTDALHNDWHLQGTGEIDGRRASAVQAKNNVVTIAMFHLSRYASIIAMLAR